MADIGQFSTNSAVILALHLSLSLSLSISQNVCLAPHQEALVSSSLIRIEASTSNKDHWCLRPLPDDLAAFRATSSAHARLFPGRPASSHFPLLSRVSPPV